MPRGQKSTTHLIEEKLQGADIEATLLAIEKADAEESLVEFIRQAWHIVEPGRPYVHGWHIAFIAAHLEAITAGKEFPDGRPYNRLLINVPPGAMKSLIVNVFWPSWEWGPKNMPHLSFLCAAHKVENLSSRDSRRMRMLVTSEWYQKRWGDRVSLARDQNEKLNFQNTAGGQRIAAAISSLTGVRADRVIIDDPHSVDSASSEAMRESEVSTFLEAIPTRLNDPIRSAIVVIMQRLHEEDVSGVILDKDMGYDHIMLPMRYEPFRSFPTALGYQDPRTDDGELLFPDRFPPEVVDRDERAMGPYATAGQFQQSPIVRGGGIIQTDWWQLWGEDVFPQLDYVVASLDTAFTTKSTNDPSAMTIWGIFSQDVVAQANKTVERFGNVYHIERTYAQPHPKAIMLHAWQDRLEIHQLVEKVAASCRRFKVDKLLIENKASGISVSQELRRLYANADFGVQMMDPGSQDKVSRLYAVQHLFAEGLVFAPDRSWADMVIQQCAAFPKGKHDDLVDTVSMAMRHMRQIGVLQRPEEVQDEAETSMLHVGGPPIPLYPT